MCKIRAKKSCMFLHCLRIEIFPMRKIYFFLHLLSCSLLLNAQDLATRMAATDYRLSYDDTRTLAVDVQSLAFFKNNEFGGDQATGYSLPGFWLQPRLTYQPLDAIRLEAGFHASVYDGANRYPCFAYHDIAQWKGSQYQRGAHILPFFRAQAKLRNMNFVLGDIYGGANHGVVEPLMNPEVNLTQDPEMGFQLLYDLPRYHLDAWINWQSFIFRKDTHQEAFTVGFSQRISLNPHPSSLNPQPSSLNLNLPIDVLIQHRGGEIDDTHTGVQTIDNAAVGVGLDWNSGRKVFNGLNAELLAMGCWQQTGSLWPFDNGWAAAATVSADLFGHPRHRNHTTIGNTGQLRLFATALYGRDFCPLYGSPFFSTYSTKTGGRFDHVLTTHVGAEWSHTFARDYVLGAKVDTYLCSTGTETLPDATTRAATFNNNFSFGIFLRCSPHFHITKIKKK